MRSEGFTLYMEPKALYNSPIAATPIPDDFEVPFGKARIRREGSDLTVVTYGNTTHMCLQAAEKIARASGASIEVIDLRSIVPFDKETVIHSIRKTGKLLIVHEDKVFSGFGAEISATINEEAFQYLDGPVRRVGSTFTPVGFSRILEKEVLPNTDKIEKAMLDLLDF
jgi:2-oxoisovalerate dehydrogenase E1 component